MNLKNEECRLLLLKLELLVLTSSYYVTTCTRPIADHLEFRIVEGSQARTTEIENRSLRVRGIPPGTEEPIVQQAFEKFARVRMVVMEVGASEALIEFENAAVRLFLFHSYTCHF